MYKFARFVNTILLAITSSTLRAQTAAPQVGDTIPESQFTEMLRLQRQKNMLVQGALVPQLNATLPNGKQLSNKSLEGKVTLLIFWYPTCGCLNFHELDSFSSNFKANPNFQIIAIGGDSVNLGYYRQSSYMPYPYAWLKDNDALRVLSFDNGFPSYMVVNPAGRIALMYTEMGIYNLNELSSKLHEILP